MLHLEGLNEKQKQAALHTTGALLVIAGAGAGKTKTITHRIVNLIHTGVAPENILAVTFTNKSAKEMRERIINEIAKNAKGQNTHPFVSTFHSLGVYIIKEWASMLSLTKHFSILDEDDAIKIIKNIIKELGLDPKENEPRKIKGAISREKGKFVNFENYRERAQSYFEKTVGEIWALYETQKHKENSLDFDDLLLKSVELLRKNPHILEHYQNKWSHIHIDEYQDTNEVQYLMSKMLSAKHKNICVVGDADQNIYSWRGANLKNILNFEKDYPGATVIFLEQNYRSTQNILLAANEVIKKNKFRPEKNLFTKNIEGEKLGLYEALDEGDEADFVATKILEIIDSEGKSVFEGTLGRSDGDGQRKSSAEDFRGESKNNFPVAREIAVLYRANFQSRALEEAMLRYNIPYQVLGTKFFERKEIKDTLAYLRSALNPANLADIKRIINFPARGIGKTTLVKLFAGEQEGLPIKMQIKIKSFYELLEDIKNKITEMKPSEVIQYVVKKSGIERELKEGGEEELERLENIKELATLAIKYDNLENGLGVEKLLEDASLASDQDSLIDSDKNQKEKNKNAIKLMTVHASKGLEFDSVFLVGLEEGLFPHERMGERMNEEDAEEERRLFYVALTRARHKLYLSFANFRTIFGSRQINSPSSFLSDIPNDIIEGENKSEGRIKTIYI